MNLADRLQNVANRVVGVREQLATEEATKNALVMPFIQALGYDVFNPAEVVPEFTADVGIKKGEKVDYAIFTDGKPFMLVECKPVGADLNKYGTQLFRYYTTTDARIAILTDGIEYRFYTDLDAPNKLDESPFLIVHMSDVALHVASDLKHLAKETLDIEAALASAENLKYTRSFTRRLKNEFESPCDDFVRFLSSDLYPGKFTKGVMDRMRPLVRRALSATLVDLVSQRLDPSGTARAAAISHDDERAEVKPQATAKEDSADTDEVVTTVDELAGFFFVKSMLRDQLDLDRVVGRDVRSYFGILLDDNNRKPICRLWFNGRTKYLGVFDSDKKETKLPIDRPEDLFKYEAQIKDSLSQVLPATEGAGAPA